MSDDIKITDGSAFCKCLFCQELYDIRFNHWCKGMKIKRTIGLEAYIKMQVEVACMLRSEGLSWSQSGAREMVDMILQQNDVEVDQ